MSPPDAARPRNESGAGGQGSSGEPSNTESNASTDVDLIWHVEMLIGGQWKPVQASITRANAEFVTRTCRIHGHQARIIETRWIWQSRIIEGW